MFKLTVTVAGLAALIGCNDLRDRDIPVQDAPDRQLEIARAEETPPSADSVAPAPAALPDPPKPARKPARKAVTVRKKEPSPTPPVASTPSPVSDSVTSPQPATPPEPVVQREPAPADTTAYAPYPGGEPAPDSAVVSPAETAAPADAAIPPADTAVQPSDTAVQPSDTAPPPAPRPAPAADSAPAPAADLTPPADADAASTLAAGTVIHAVLEDSIHSRHDVSGKLVSGSIMQNVTGPDGQVVIPAGSPVQFTVTQVKPGRGERPGVLEMRVDSVTIGGKPMSLAANIQPVPHELRGRGVTGDEAAKVGVGAAGGAVVGRVIGGNTRGAVIGGVVGAAGGAVVASKTAARDVVVKARTPVVFVLSAPLVVAR
ncbi:MAG: hypothetical protein H0T50_16620 [Gemmatimonadales bacterium]|nr:hypothetical protein [Gemmatimonadales bacterium]